MAGGTPYVLVVVWAGRGEKQVEAGMAGVNRAPFFILETNETRVRIIDIQMAGLATMDPLNIEEIQRLLEPRGNHLVDLVAWRHEIEQRGIANRVSH